MPDARRRGCIMTDTSDIRPVYLPEDDVIQAKVRLDRIKAIADSLTTVERNGYTDELFEGTILNLMETIDGLVEESKELLKY